MTVIVAGVQARMGSTRLPGKALRPLAGKPLVEWTLDRVALSKRLSQVWLLTTIEPGDDPLAAAVEDLVPVIRGSETDVRSRFRTLLDFTRADHLVRVTADCPFADGRLIDELIELHLRDGADYSHIAAQPEFSVSYPNGFNAEVFTAAAFGLMESLGDAPPFREHVTWAVAQSPERFRTARLLPSPALSRPNIKLSVDTEGEFERVRRIVDALGAAAPGATAREIVAVVDAHPEWFDG
jgi:spore coat polysaccharide biosynthesis protein SpsF